jgi:hypothetical protein
MAANKNFFHKARSETDDRGGQVDEGCLQVREHGLPSETDNRGGQVDEGCLQVREHGLPGQARTPQQARPFLLHRAHAPTASERPKAIPMSQEHKWYVSDSDGINVAMAINPKLAQYIADAFNERKLVGAPFKVSRYLRAKQVRRSR